MLRRGQHGLYVAGMFSWSDDHFLEESKRSRRKFISRYDFGHSELLRSPPALHVIMVGKGEQRNGFRGVVVFERLDGLERVEALVINVDHASSCDRAFSKV
jgi:hypothetical protein